MSAVATAVAPRTPPQVAVRTGARYWCAACVLALRWKWASLRLFLAVLFVVQLLSGVGFILGFSLFFQHVPPTAALYLATGVPVMSLVMLGQILTPQIVSRARSENTYDFLRTMPIPVTADTAAGCVLALAVGVPAMLLSLLAAAWFYGVGYTISPLIVPAVLLTAATGTMLGDALAHAISRPMLIMVASQVFIFVIMGFSPVNFPAGQLPGWLARLNLGLPFTHMAATVRGALTTGVVDGVATSYLVLAAWCLAAGALAIRARTRRG